VAFGQHGCIIALLAPSGKAALVEGSAGLNLQQGLMAIHLALRELALPQRIAVFEGNVLRALRPVGV